jgi:aminopeptidase S
VKYFENATDLAIADAGAAVLSPIAVTGLTGRAPSALKVAVDIKHAFRGDLAVDLIAPDGSVYRLKRSSAADSAANLSAVYTVNASTEVAAGTWKLQVRDVYKTDTGYLDKWSLQF